MLILKNIIILVPLLFLSFSCGYNSSIDVLDGKFVPELSVTKVISINSNLIQVTFDVPVDSDSAEEITNYEIADNNLNKLNTSKIGIQSKNDNVVEIETDTQTAGIEYKITIRNVSGTGRKALPSEGIIYSFTGIGKFVNMTAPILLSPQDQEVSQDLTPFFTWSAQEGVENYYIQLSTDPTFENQDKIILSFQTGTNNYYQLLNQHLIGINNLREETYYWRIRSDVSSFSEPFSFDILSPNVVYVDISSTESIEIGNKKKPYKSIQAAINNAGGFDSPKMVWVAKGDYFESISLAKNVQLLGGYDSQLWRRNILTNTSSIYASGPTAVYISNAKNALINGFTIYCTNSDYQTLTGVHISSSSPTCSKNNIITGNTNAISSYSILLDDSSNNAYISDNTIYIIDSYMCTAIYSNIGSGLQVIGNYIVTKESGATGVIQGIQTLATSSSVISGNIIQMGETKVGSEQSSTAIYFSYSDMYIYNNFLFGGTSILSFGIFGEQTLNLVPVKIYNNVIKAGCAMSNSVGIRLLQCNFDIENNTITSGECLCSGIGSSILVTGTNVENGNLLNNLMLCTLATSNHFGISQLCTIPSSSYFLYNNFLYNFSNGFYNLSGSNILCTSYPSIDDELWSFGVSSTNNIRGNITSTALIGAIFLDPSNTDNYSLNDFKPKNMIPNSPIIDQGTTSNVFTDILNNLRGQDNISISNYNASAYDIGAFEYEP